MGPTGPAARNLEILQSTIVFIIISQQVMFFLAEPTAQILQPSTRLYDFCSRTLSVKACPTPPTIDNVVLSTFLGSYYEIGSTARFKFTNELGMVCAKANFSANESPSPGQNTAVTINVLNSGLQVVGSQTISAMSKLASSATDVCANARRMCAILSPGSKVSDALWKMSAVTQQIAMALPTEAALLRQAATILNTALSGVESRLDNLAREVNSMVGTAAQLNQAVGPVDALLGDLRGTVARGGVEARGIGAMAIGNLSVARSLITEAASHLSGGYEEQLTEAATLIEQEVDQITSQITRIEGQLSSVGGPLAEMIGADRAATNVTATLKISTGEAIQRPDQRGNLALRTKQSTQPYQIIVLEGLPMVGYTAALIYSCETDSNGDPSADLFMLSREPTLPVAAVNRLLDVARTHNIFTDCESAFVPTVQRGGRCGAPLQ